MANRYSYHFESPKVRIIDPSQLQNMDVAAKPDVMIVLAYDLIRIEHLLSSIAGAKEIIAIKSTDLY
jgi:hypothetical protein